jgi:hypothetical protein
MCRGGRMFAPTKVWRKWHRRCNVRLRSRRHRRALPRPRPRPPHRDVPEFPLVVSDSAEGVEKTAQAIKVLKQLGAYADAEKAKDSVGIRPGVGKMRNRRYINLIVYGTEGSKIVKAFRNLTGVDVANVERLKLNPYFRSARRMAVLAEAARVKARKDKIDSKTVRSQTRRRPSFHHCRDRDGQARRVLDAAALSPWTCAAPKSR